MVSGMEELRRRLEVLLGAKPEAPIDTTSKEESEREAEVVRQRQARVAEAGGELLGAAFKFLGELVTQAPESQAAPDGLVRQVREGLQQCVEVDESGKHRLTVAFPDARSVENLADVLARFLVAGKSAD